MDNSLSPTTLRRVLRAGAVHAALLVFVGVLAGGVGGFLALASDGTQETAEAAARPFVALTVLLPLALLVLNFSPPNLDVYSSPARALLIGVVGGLGGGLIGALGYLAPGTNIPVILGGEDAADLSTALRSEIGLAMYALVVGLSATVGLLAGVATHYRIKAFRHKQSRSG